MRDAWDRAMPRKVGHLRGPVLHGAQAYTVVVPPRTPAGRYIFFCLPHRAYDMRLAVDVP